MNDFTKEELEDIDYTLETVYLGNSNLRKKVSAMIDNYHCVHENDGMSYTSLPPQNRCKKCGEFYR